VEFAYTDLLGKQRGPHTHKRYYDEIGNLLVDLGSRVICDGNDRENDAHARSPEPVSQKYKRVSCDTHHRTVVKEIVRAHAGVV
jgi:hypothetical protein